MFTGIVDEVGQVTRIERGEGFARLGIGCTQVLADAKPGSSIAVNGCCLTLAAVSHGGFQADLMFETLRVTTLGDLGIGDPVNLERPLPADGRFGGHLVQGHVDGVGQIVARVVLPGTVLMAVTAPTALSRYLTVKGSVAVQGVSLTVVDVDGDGTFRVGLVPHTCAVTTLGGVRVGERVNLEADIIAKYVERLLDVGEPREGRG